MNYRKLPIFAESWNVAYRRKTANGLMEDDGSPFIVIMNSFRYWAADPFLFEDGKDVYVFAELYDYIKRRGVIGYCKISENKCKWKPVIEEAYHLSFPCIFRKGNQIYIMPEANQSGRLYLYRAVRFPDIWEKSVVLRENVKYADTTPFCMKNKEMAITLDLSEQVLRLLNFTDNLDCVADASRVAMKRPAGYIDYQKGVRVAQNGEKDYGQGLVFYSFSVNNSAAFQEQELCRVFPEDINLSKKMHRIGMHTYNISNNYEVIDIKTRRFNILNLISRIISKLK